MKIKELDSILNELRGLKQELSSLNSDIRYIKDIFQMQYSSKTYQISSNYKKRLPEKTEKKIAKLVKKIINGESLSELKEDDFTGL